MTLLEECIEALGKNICILGDNEKQVVEGEFYKMIPLTTWGRVDWDRFKNKREIKSASDLIQLINNEKYYIIWGDIEMPIIKSELINILNTLDDVIAVSFDTWLLSEDKSLVIEFYHESNITIGVISDLI